MQDKLGEQVDFYKIISSIHMPKNFSSSDKQGNSPFIIQFNSNTESSEILSIFHNKKLADKFIKVSFVSDETKL